MPTWFVVLTGLVLIVAIISAVLTAPEEELGLVLVVLLLLAVVFSLFFRMRVRITTGELHFGFKIWRKRLPLQDIQVLGMESIPLLAGLGIHYYAGKWIYSARFKGQGVHLVYQGKKHYIIGSNHPDVLLSALRTAIGR
ncbi:MAG: hypothetical protein V1784_07085 [bacterium]